MGIKIIGQIRIWDTAENVMRISETADLRAKFAASVMDVMDQLQLDGIFFQWMWPGCPRVPPSNLFMMLLHFLHFQYKNNITTKGMCKAK
jgi:GH18 family chitinase